MNRAIRASIVIANYNGAPFLEAAIASARAQSIADLEIIVVDDCSTDDSMAIAERIALSDPRVVVERLERNSGPGGARNHAIERARGDWIAILDSDDLMHPRRLEWLIAAAEADDADIVADDLLLFDEDGGTPPRTFLPSRPEQPFWLDLADYLNAGVLLGHKPNLGFLKPVVRRAPLVAGAIRYDPALRIAEDDYFVIRMLAAGMRYRIVPLPTYFYRKHGSSISHRLKRSDIEAMATASATARNWVRQPDRNIARGFARREAAFARALAFTDFVAALKARRIFQALGLAARHPSMLPLTQALVKGALAKRRKRVDSAPAPGGPHLTIVSRQRLAGRTNGSSTYLLEVAAAARRAGFVPHLVQPSPTLLGRMPFFRLRSEMAVFETHQIRGVVRVGDWVVARDPRIWWAAIVGTSRRLLKRAGLHGAWLAERKAPHAIAVPWNRDDAIFLATNARPTGDVLIADYMFQADGLPYALRPDARTAIVMHDLFHARSGGDQTVAKTDSVTQVDRDVELAMLGSVDAVIAIQAAEAAFVNAHVARVETILMQSGARVVTAPQPGTGLGMLFVGSNTAPNVEGLRWFFETVWPLVRHALPDIRLDIAGTVANPMREVPDGVRFLGLVGDLAPLYRSAALLISPLTFGSGLKIKLIEALAAGKAAVVTSVTLQGVEDVVGDAVALADEPDAFAAAIVRLLERPDERAALAARARLTAKRHFDPAVTQRRFVEWLHAPAVVDV